MKKSVLIAAAAALAVCLSAPVLAETVTSSDGVLSIDLPTENWKVVDDPAQYMLLSDGANMITIEHLSNGEKLPEMTVADDHYVNVFQAAYSTQNEVFIITGSVVDAAVIPDVTKGIMSVKVLKYDTKTAVRQNETPETQAPASEYTIAPMNATMYTTAGINVRASYSTKDEVIGGLAEGSAVTVTGSVQKDGQDIGWYQIAYGSGSGFVSADFITSTAPAQSGSKLTFTGNAKTIYKADGTAITVYEASDGNWYDGNGRCYVWSNSNGFSLADGSETFSVNKPTNSDFFQVGSAFTVYWPSGATETLALYSDGYYYSSKGVRYWDNNDNTFGGADGSVLLGSLGGPSEPVVPDDANETHKLISRETGAGVIVSAGGGAYYDEEGTEYAWISDGGMMDFYGHEYDVIW